MSRSTVCLAMIVKNESPIIRRCLDSAKPWIDSYCIIDTGSSDDTTAVISREMQDVPGDLLERPWVDFAHNRTELLKEARKQGADYLLLLDADHTIEAQPDSFDNLTADSYLIELPSPQMSYSMPYLVKSSVPFFYLSPTHEYITASEPFLQEKHLSLLIFHHGDGGTRPEKYDRDKALLEKEYEKDPTNERTVFYLAATYNDGGDKDGALRLFRQRAELGGWEEEVYYSLLQVARLTDSTDDYLKAHIYRSGRPEATHWLMRHFNELNAHQLVIALWKVYDPQWTKDLLFVETWCHDYGIKFEAAIALWWTGTVPAAKSLFEEVMEVPTLPEHYRQLCESNLAFCE